MMKTKDCSCGKVPESPVKNKKIVLEERKSKITFINDKEKSIHKICVECRIGNKEGEEKCDYLLIDEDNTEYFVELKGCDVEKAINQIKNSISKLSKTNNKDNIWCFVISTKVPGDSSTSNAVKKIKKQYPNTIVRSSNYEFNIPAQKK